MSFRLTWMCVGGFLEDTLLYVGSMGNQTETHHFFSGPYPGCWETCDLLEIQPPSCQNVW